MRASTERKPSCADGGEPLFSLRSYVTGSPRPPQMIFYIGSDKMTGTEVCEGCCEVIYDRFVMRVGNSPWHEDCLFCSECHTPLSNSCYYKEGRLLCRGDYERRFGVKCGRCAQCLLPHDLVMRTRFSIYHIGCFVCTVCARTLNRGKFTNSIFPPTVLNSQICAILELN